MTAAASPRAVFTDDPRGAHDAAPRRKSAQAAAVDGADGRTAHVLEATLGDVGPVFRPLGDGSAAARRAFDAKKDAFCEDALLAAVAVACGLGDVRRRE